MLRGFGVAIALALCGALFAHGPITAAAADKVKAKSPKQTRAKNLDAWTWPKKVEDGKKPGQFKPVGGLKMEQDVIEAKPKVLKKAPKGSTLCAPVGSSRPGARC